jgi:hypothetical protein
MVQHVHVGMNHVPHTLEEGHHQAMECTSCLQRNTSGRDNLTEDNSTSSKPHMAVLADKLE